ncbi:MAG: T9SS type A sorting domain-containing protein [Bacteroidia bacterium]
MTFVKLDNLLRNLPILLFLFLGFTSFGQNKKILWIGNSYTNYNNLPQMFKNLALSGGDSVIFDSSTPGGYTFSAHASNQATLDKIALGNWDYVILQAQSQEPSFPPGQVMSQTLPYAVELDSLIQLASPCAKTVYYLTWGRKYGDSQNCANYPPLCTFEGMNNRLRWGYKTMADETESLIAPVGSAWKTAWFADSTINLWNADNSHPSNAGSYLAACTFYSTIFRKPSLGLEYSAGLSANTASFLQGVADQTVNDSLDVWNIGRFIPQSNFSFAANGLEYTFQHEALQAEEFYWDFGDGSTSDLPSPAHTYANAGVYEVSLIAGRACEYDTSTTTLNVVVANVKENETLGWRIFPNPANDQVMIQAVESERFHIAVYSITGKLVKAFDQEGSLIMLDFSDFEKGVYQIVCSAGNDQKIFRILKD